MADGLDFSDLQPSQGGMSFDDLHPSDSGLAFDDLQPATPTNWRSLPMAKQDEGAYPANPAAPASVPPPVAPDPSTQPLANGLPSMPQSGNQAYMGAQAVRPQFNQDMPYTPDGRVIVPGQGNLAAAGNQAGQSLIGSAGSLVGGVGDIVAGGIQNNKDALANQLDVMKKIDNGEKVAPVDDPLGYQDMSQDQRQTFRNAYEITMRQHIDAPVTPNNLQTAGNAINDYAQQNFPVDSTQVNNTLTKIGGAVGGLPPLLIAAAAGGPGAAAAMAGVQSYDSAYKQAKAGGASEADAHSAALSSGLTSAALMAPSAAILLRGLPIAIQNTVVGQALDYAASSGTMVGQDQVQRLVDNAVARQYYDPDRSYTQGVGDPGDMLAAGFAGLAGHVAAHAPDVVRAGVAALRTPDAAPELQQGAAGITQAATDYQNATKPADQTQPAENAAQPADPIAQKLNAQGYTPAEVAEMPPEIAQRLSDEGAPKPGGQAEQPSSTAPITGDTFQDRAAGVVSRLMSDLNLTREQAAGLVGNLGHESGLDAIQEQKPQGGGRGGFGWGQWTGVRRNAFEQFAKDTGGSVTDSETNYQFLVHELTGPESGALAALKQAGSVEDATKVVQDKYERPGVAATGSRLKFAREAMDAAPSADPSPQPVNRLYAGNMAVDTTPQLMELSDLIASHDADGKVNPDYPHEDGLQPRDRSTVGSQDQVRDIASNLNPAMLMPHPDASGGAPIVAPDGKTVENGNGRVAALSLAYNDPSLASQGAAYRQFLASQGHDVSGMKQPVLVSKRITPLADDARQQFIKATADRNTLAMTSAERARADADTAGRAIDLWNGANAGAAANAPFVRSFMQGVPPAERGGMMAPDGTLSSAGEKRVQSAVVAHAYGDQLGPTLDRFVNDDAEGIKGLAGALNDAAGSWAQMRSEAAKGFIPPTADITPDLAHAVQIVDRARQTGRPVAELLGQSDLDRPVSPMTEDLVRGFFRDPAMTKPAGRDVVASRLREYANEAMREQPGPDMFGNQPRAPHQLLEAASLRAARRQASVRDEDGVTARAETAQDADARDISPDAVDARERLRTTAQSVMRYLGLPPEVGLKLADQIIVGGRALADGTYSPSQKLIELAMDTAPADLPKKLFHEAVHALMDPELGLLSKGQRDTLLMGADNWLRQNGHRETLEKLYGNNRELLREEAVARLGEDLFSSAMTNKTPVARIIARMANAVRGMGQALRGQGYHTAEDVFRGVMNGERAGAGSREMLAGMAAQPNQEDAAKQAEVDASPNPTASAIEQFGQAPDRYMSLRDQAATAGEGIYHRYTNGKTPHNDSLGYGMYAADEGKVSSAYGKNHWVVDASKIDPAQVIDAGSRKFRSLVLKALKDSEIPREYQTTAARLADELNPEDIVNSAAVWDSPEIVQHIWDKVLEPNGWHAVRTQDGLISFDPDHARAGEREPLYSKRLAPLLSDKLGLERAGQLALPGAERDERGAMQRKMDTPTLPKAQQKAVDDLPLFSSETKQSSLFSLRQNLTRAVRDASEEPRAKLNAMINQAAFPMRAGTEQAQNIAMKFANALRGIAFRYGAIDRQMVKSYTPEERSAMGKALDAQSVFEQRVRSGDATEADRAAFDQGKTGLAGLTDKQRGDAEALNTLAKQTWQRMVDRKIVMPGAEGIPYYMPRQFVMMDSLGARRIKAADNKLDGKGGSGGGGLTSMDQKGGNLNTSGPKSREHLEAEDSLSGARAKYGDNVHLVTDVRSLLDAVRRQEQSIAGRDMVDAIKQIGVESGTEMVREGAKPRRGFFTLDHPSLWTVGPTGETDEAGKPIYGRTPLHIDEQFRGPLNAVLSSPNPDWYRALTGIKSKSMNMIMFSPAMHLMVEVGRSLPLYGARPDKLISTMMRARQMIGDRAFMDQAISDGLAPIGRGWDQFDATSIVNQAADLPARSMLGKVWNGDTKPQRAWHNFHQKVLWDNVFRLQTGIYNDMKTKYTDMGFSPKAAGIMAAHLANRYAGALPPEHLSKAMNIAANVSMFSRSYTLGNLAVMKDMLNGAPSHLKAALMADLGPNKAASDTMTQTVGKLAKDAVNFYRTGDLSQDTEGAVRALRRKAISAFVMDIGMFYGMNALAQSGFSVARNMMDGDGLPEAAGKAWQEYADHYLPQEGNEPGKENRVYVGNDTSGTGVYARLPAGKVGEDFMGWMPIIGHPGSMIQAKMNPLLRSTYEAISGQDSLGRKLYNPNPQGISDKLKIAGQAVMHIAASLTPADFANQVYDSLTGQSKGDGTVAAARILGPLTGMTSISQGNPGGPEAGVERAQMAHDDYEHMQAKTEAKRLYSLGREDDARAVLDKSYADDPRGSSSAWRNIVAPEKSQVRFSRQFMRTANDDARARAASVNGAR